MPEKIPLRRFDDREKLNAVMDAISAYRIHGGSDWTTLTGQFPETRTEEIVPVPEGIFERGDRFEGVATVYARLNDDRSSNSFPAHFEGYCTRQPDGSWTAFIDEFSIDTSTA